MATAMIYLGSIGALLLIGILSSILSDKIKFPNILLLIIAGIIMSRLSYRGSPLIDFPAVFLTSLAILALVIMIFDSTSRLKLKEFDEFALKSLNITLIVLFFNIIFFSAATYYIAGIKSLALSLLFATLMAGTSPDVVLTFFHGKVNKVIELLEIESIINTPIIVLFPFLILDFLANVQATFDLPAVTKLFFIEIVAGIGAGILVGIIIFKVMRKQYSEHVSPIAIITAALLTYVAAEALGGNGVLAVTTLGVFFGSITLKEKKSLYTFSYMFANSLEILVFVLVGFIIKIPLTVDFLLVSLALFAIMLLIRWVGVSLALWGSDYTKKEIIFMSLNCSKGVAVATVAFTLSTFTTIPGMDIILNLTLAFVLYSIVLATILVRFSKYFIRLKV